MPASSVDLGVISAVLPLSTSRVVLMAQPLLPETASQPSPDPGDQPAPVVLVLEGSELTRLPATGLGQDPWPVLSRVGASRALLSTTPVTAADGAGATRSWWVVDAAAGVVGSAGQGQGTVVAQGATGKALAVKGPDPDDRFLVTTVTLPLSS